VLSIDNVILSDRDLRRELGAGRIRVEPMDAGAVQPSSIDLR
jgi:dCTP deaminase